MRINDAAFAVANTMSDIRSQAGMLITGIKQLSQDEHFQKHPLRDVITGAAQRLESILNREVK